MLTSLCHAYPFLLEPNRFLVDQYSELYYDPTPLLDAVKKQSEADSAEEQQQQQQHNQQQMLQQPHQSHPRHHTPRIERDFHMSNMHHQMGPVGHDPSQHHRQYPPPVSYPYPSTPPNMNMNMRGSAPMPGPYHGGPGGAPFNAAPPNQFYGNEGATPMRMGPLSAGIGGMGMDHSHGIGHPLGGMGMGGGGIPGIPMNLTPDRRRMTRGMMEEGFPMH